VKLFLKIDNFEPKFQVLYLILFLLTMNKTLKVILIVLLIAVLGLATVYFFCGCGPIFKTSNVKAPALSTAELSSVNGTAWLELPGEWRFDAEHCITHYAEMEGRMQRNYTALYDEDTYTSYWVAYPLCSSHTTTGREEIWGYDPKVEREFQTSVKSGYGANVPTVNYPKNFYARGHQIPNADRNAVPQMQAQTYYSTNMTPQIQNGFNGGIWAELEEAVRNIIPLGDTLYVVTGASFRKMNENLAALRITNKNDGKSLPVPNYYWKVILKVKREGTSISDAGAIGFWLPHKDLKGHEYSDYVVSVDTIEEWTGFDFFVNVPDEKEKPAETNMSWQAFISF
jgi:endonuclease G